MSLSSEGSAGSLMKGGIQLTLGVVFASHLSYLRLMTIVTHTPEVLSTAELVRATSKVGDKSK